jgi:hypothetical protein
MGSLPPPNGVPNAYDEAERGTQEAHSGPPTVSAPRLIEEKMVDVKEAKSSVVVSSEVVPVPVNNAPASKPPAKKRKVSKWILWKLWFNTYRYVWIMSAGRVPDTASGPTR